jgi:hypothetical protein
VSPLEFIPEDQRDPDQVIRDAQLEMEHAKAAYDAAYANWVQLMEAHGREIAEPVRRWN